MKVDFYALDQLGPTLTISGVRYFDLWPEIRDELAGYYGERAESFRITEASWNGDDEYAELVMLKGRVVGAFDRPITQTDLATIWGVDQMEKRAFSNRIRSLYNIDGDLLPELTREQQSAFLANPVRFFLDASEMQSDAIMREVEARQNVVVRNGERPLATKSETQREGTTPALTKAARTRKPRATVDGQRELLLPITGGAGKVAVQGDAQADVSANRKAG